MKLATTIISLAFIATNALIAGCSEGNRNGHERGVGKHFGIVKK
jgi:hypothetical protein